MSAVVERSGVMRPLDRKAEPTERVTKEQVSDPDRLSRLIQGVMRDVSDLKRPWAPRTIDHQDVSVDNTGTTLYRLPHGFGGRVNWYVVDWTGAAGPQLSKDTATDNNTLVLVSYVTGTASIRIEEAG